MNISILFISVLTFIFAEVNANIPQSIQPFTPIRPKEHPLKDLHGIGKEYMDLMNQIGSHPKASYDQRITRLFSPNCKKIVNGALWYEGSENYLPQLQTTAEKIGFWSIEPLDIIPGKDNKTVVIRFLVHTKGSLLWNTLVILRVDDSGRITEINEVFNNYEGK